jgi:hypothetical protein
MLNKVIYQRLIPSFPAVHVQSQQDWQEPAPGLRPREPGLRLPDYERHSQRPVRQPQPRGQLRVTHPPPPAGRCHFLFSLGREDVFKCRL